MRIIASALILVAMLVGCATAPVMEGEKNSYETNPFRHIRGVYLAVSKLSPDIEIDGLSKDQILTDVELRLRQAQIRVLNPEEFKASHDLPNLFVVVSTAKQPEGYYIYYATLQFNRLLRSLRPDDSTLTLAGTFQTLGKVSMTRGTDVRKIRDDLGCPFNRS